MRTLILPVIRTVRRRLNREWQVYIDQNLASPVVQSPDGTVLDLGRIPKLALTTALGALFQSAGNGRIVPLAPGTLDDVLAMGNAGPAWGRHTLATRGLDRRVYRWLADVTTGTTALTGAVGTPLSVGTAGPSETDAGRYAQRTPTGAGLGGGWSILAGGGRGFCEWRHSPKWSTRTALGNSSNGNTWAGLMAWGATIPNSTTLTSPHACWVLGSGDSFWSVSLADGTTQTTTLTTIPKTDNTEYKLEVTWVNGADVATFKGSDSAGNEWTGTLSGFPPADPAEVGWVCQTIQNAGGASPTHRTASVYLDCL